MPALFSLFFHTTILSSLFAFFPADLSELMKDLLDDDDEEVISQKTVTTTHTYTVGEKSLEYQAKVGRIPIFDHHEKPICELFYVGYFASLGKNRPVTFFFPGGPGGSSGVEIIASVGPKRIQTSLEGKKLIPPYKIGDNPQTILPWTDLVFVDPPGTGYSKWVKSKDNPLQSKERLFQTEVDLGVLAEFVDRFTQKYELWNHPKYLAGISYGASRCCGLCERLLTHDISLHGIILISPAIDYISLISQHNLPLADSFLLPTFAATAWYHGRLWPEASLEKVLEYARNFSYQEYLPSMIHPSGFNQKRDSEFYTKLSQLIGLKEETVFRYGGRFSEDLFTQEFFGDERKILGGCDTRYASEISSYSEVLSKMDPSYYDMQGVLCALKSYLQKDLNFPLPETPYISYCPSNWNFRTYDSISWPEFLQRVERTLIYNPQMKVFVGCGYFDCRTPFMAVEYSFDHLHPSYKNRVDFSYYEGGHGFLLDHGCLKKFHQDLVSFYQKSPLKFDSYLLPQVPSMKKQSEK